MTTVFVPKESLSGETRVALVPETTKRLIELKLRVELESGAAQGIHLADEVFTKVGAVIVGPDAWSRADLVLKVQPPTCEEVARMKRGAVLVSFVVPSAHRAAVDALAAAGVSTLAMDLIPRISRAQAMDALSSQATVAGYKAVLLGATHLSKMCPLLMTAAGTVKPARVVVFGAGVAGLQAIATAKRLGCVVEATDVRRAVKEQVESLGARFIDVPGGEDLSGEGGYAKEASPEFLARQREEVAKRVGDADLVITTALVPGRPAPKLVSSAMVKSMRPGSVIVDMAVESGGNCEESQAGAVVERHGVTIVGLKNLPATVPLHASELYSKNVLNLVRLFVDKDGKMSTDFTDEVLAGALLTYGGQVTHKPTLQALTAQGAAS
ncbi:MAG: Re/Si-specific NAD(P)(+) transhydrogenase subunit alpha [Planctomycetota bacterium]